MPIACSFSSACRIALRHPHSFPTRRSSDLEATGGQLLVNREGAREFLESQGVPFPPGASAHFLPQSSRLIVRNTIDNLELVDSIVEQASVAGPKQVEMQAKFVEFDQKNYMHRWAA